MFLAGNPVEMVDTAKVFYIEEEIGIVEVDDKVEMIDIEKAIDAVEVIDIGKRIDIVEVFDTVGFVDIAVAEVEAVGIAAGIAAVAVAG